ncbi:MAG TPA: hypothetical protein VJ823_07485 [Rhodanobacteraceae bacterium]|nr:hypothetical protein [Rhodanobacteraceae bacterium]
MIMRKFSTLCIASMAVVLAACSSGQPSSGSSGSGGLAAAIDNTVTSALDQAQTKLRNEPLHVSPEYHYFPDAQITPQGDFIVGGKTVAITPAQRSALLAYREQMISVASQGIAIGKQGSALGMRAASEAIAGALSGKSSQAIPQSMKVQATSIREAAAKLCDRMPTLMASQQKLAAELPAFRPYADLTPARIDECRKDALRDDGSDG